MAFCITLTSPSFGITKEQEAEKKYIMEKAAKPAQKDEDSLCSKPDKCCPSCDECICLCSVFCLIVCCCQNLKIFG